MARRGDGLYLRGKTWYLDCCINGTRHQRRLGKGIPRSVAGELAQVQRAAILKGEAGIGKKRKDLPFDEARKKFEAWMQAEKRPSTQRGYRQCLAQLAGTFSGQRLGAITPWALEAYKKARVEAGAPIRVNRELAVLKTLVNRCVAWGLYEGENPVRAVKFRQEPKTRLRWLELEEERRLLEAASEPLRTLLLVGLYTGLRLHAEALTLRWEDVDLRRGHLTVPAAYAKNGQTRTVPLNSLVRAALARLKPQAIGGLVFARADGTPYHSIRTAFTTACRRAELAGVTPHTLRHTFASRLVMAGTDLRTIQELGGWQVLGMVERYSHLSPGHKAQAVERIAAEFPYAIHYAQESSLAIDS